MKIWFELIILFPFHFLKKKKETILYVSLSKRTLLLILTVGKCTFMGVLSQLMAKKLLPF